MGWGITRILYNTSGDILPARVNTRQPFRLVYLTYREVGECTCGMRRKQQQDGYYPSHFFLLLFLSIASCLATLCQRTTFRRFCSVIVLYHRHIALASEVVDFIIQTCYD